MRTSNVKLAVLAIAISLFFTGLLMERAAPGAKAEAGPASAPVTLDTTRPVAEIETPAAGWNFRNHVIPVLTRLGCNSGACHGALAGKGGFKLTLRGYDPELDFNVMTRQALGRRVNRSEPARSLLLLKPTMTIGHGGGKRLNVESLEYKVLSEWIAGGLAGPAESDPKIVRLDVTPREATLSPGQAAQLRVVAHYSDGHAEDVTRWVKYSTADAAVASVDDDGSVRAGGHGETAISLWYQSNVSFARVANPFPHAIPPEVFANAPRNNFVDDLILRKLQTLRIAPSAQSGDGEFVRRAYLDATGTLPTAREAAQFIQDPAPEKRAQLIEALLQRDEYVDYWTNRHADTLLVSSRLLRENAMWSFYNWIRESVATNKPYDQFVREIVTANGNTLENGAANYYVLHKETTELNENFSMAFLGMSITCARCHNHPLEKWTQKQYYQMANLFARIGMKNGARDGDVQVYTNPFGEVNLPRLGKPLPPTPLDGVPLAFDAATDRREHLANWLTAPSNPYFARSFVNRVWKNFMGRGLVEAVDDMRATNPPSNEELLAALTRDFTDHKFDVKRLIRTIMNSAAYQRSSTPNETNRQDERFYSRYVIRRLPAEALLDAVSQVTGAPTIFPNFAAGTRAMQVPDARVNNYFLTVFGKPLRMVTVESERTAEPSVAQALHTINGDTINEKLRAPGGVVDSFIKLGLSDEMVIQHLYLAALSRAPRADEAARLLAALREAKAGAASPQEALTARRQAIEDVAWAILTSKEFLFNH
ncbi:MAG: DUF1553 domain-containing protein [Blastocatellia bacterium]|nr:DUF1553 domain-containing protein [Blastocatellia bacterium]